MKIIGKRQFACVTLAFAQSDFVLWCIADKFLDQASKVASSMLDGKSIDVIWPPSSSLNATRANPLNVLELVNLLVSWQDREACLREQVEPRDLWQFSRKQPCNIETTLRSCISCRIADSSQEFSEFAITPSSSSQCSTTRFQS